VEIEIPEIRRINASNALTLVPFHAYLLLVELVLNSTAFQASLKRLTNRLRKSVYE